MIHQTDKFIAFVDIVGFKSLVHEAEAGRGLSMSELSDAVEALGAEDDRKEFEKYGPLTCPKSPRIRQDLDFQLTQVSDCVIASTEISPAGLINLLAHCSCAHLKLLKKGLMCRGYVGRGYIYHTKDRLFGSGMSDAVEREKQVSIFRRSADERGTPFIEISRAVHEYVETQPDDCVKMMFSRFVKTEGDLSALFPFKRLSHSFLMGGVGVTDDLEKERASVNVVRGWIHNFKKQVMRHVDTSNSDAVCKGEQYIRMLDAQLEECDKTEEMLNDM